MLVDFLIAPLVPEQVDITVAWQLLERQHRHDIFAPPVHGRGRPLCVFRCGDEVIDHVVGIVDHRGLVLPVGNDDIILPYILVQHGCLPFSREQLNHTIPRLSRNFEHRSNTSVQCINWRKQDDCPPPRYMRQREPGGA